MSSSAWWAWNFGAESAQVAGIDEGCGAPQRPAKVLVVATARSAV